MYKIRSSCVILSVSSPRHEKSADKIDGASFAILFSFCSVSTVCFFLFHPAAIYMTHIGSCVSCLHPGLSRTPHPGSAICLQSLYRHSPSTASISGYRCCNSSSSDSSTSKDVNPGVSKIILPSSSLMVKSSECLVVCLPLSDLALMLPVSATASGFSLFSIVDLPTPDGPCQRYFHASYPVFKLLCTLSVHAVQTYHRIYRSVYLPDQADVFSGFPAFLPFTVFILCKIAFIDAENDIRACLFSHHQEFIYDRENRRRTQRRLSRSQSSPHLL